MRLNRRELLYGAAAVAATTTFPSLVSAQVKQLAASCPFHLAVINDEISPDLDHAAYIASKEFGLHHLELRNINGKGLHIMSSDELAEAKKILAKYQLKVTDIGSPLFKSDLPGAPLSKDSPKRKNPSAPDVDQDALLDRCIDLAKTFGTDRIRCFDFWRLDDAAAYRKQINQKLDEAASKCSKHGLVLVLENEMACNTGSGAEALATLNGVPNRGLMLNWDPGNSGTFATDVPFPDDYERLPKSRIGHVHAKNVRMAPETKSGWEWQPVDIGKIDWAAQFKALKRDGYTHAVSLETHWHGGGTPENSTRRSMQGLMACMEKAELLRS
ncbi:sugar phosphate isomerase/epimerase family protein [Terriglobus roseus]|uniref:Sugar phosphate isomerase/epimerase n=1 Tax=Terriglobus roseus TaxID=392734 RepID=A0A1H4SEZ2_9BACT|nr:sugar phosphate isomerase/epimerase family protein [Terriglobus roseus]SEC42766.1 Sugar phosphate isomerase/epimerase [Terriglobus roseus]